MAEINLVEKKEKRLTKEKFILYIPAILVSILGVGSFYITCRSTFNYLSILIGQFNRHIPSFFLFGDPMQPGWIGFLFSIIWLITGWLISTKYKKLQTPFWRQLWFWNMFVGVLTYYLWNLTSAVYTTIVPYLSERISKLPQGNVWSNIALGDTNNLLIILVFVPTIVVFMILMWLSGEYSQYSTQIKEAFLDFEFKNPFLQKVFKFDQKEHWPDVVLGPDSETKELIVQPGRDRTLNNVIIGSIGTGKTAALVLPIINQDLHWMTRYINEFPKLYQREDFHTEEVKGMYLNGVSIIEPSNDLCQKAFQLVKAHGVPEESVFYIDPTNPNTPSINPMQGPVDKCAEAFSMVIEGLAEGGNSNFFFQQSERNHLKHYIYLLKLHDPDQEVTFDMLLKMYDNPQLVHVMHEKLKETIPKDFLEIEDRDLRNHWAIVKQIDEWFDMNHLPKTDRNGAPVLITQGEYRTHPAYYDAKAEYVQGLRNILNDIGANPLIRRVLFGKSKFDFDAHLESGGVLLVNSAKGELSGLSNILGKLILLSLQNAVFRRKPNVSNFHHILVDEFPDYVFQSFKEFPAQSRKYKVIVTVVAQTIAQLADKYGENYMHTLLGTLRHKMVYGDIPDYDAQLFSKIFGEKKSFEEGVTEQSVNPLNENPSSRKGNSYTKLKDAILSPSDIIYQKAFQCAIKIVANNTPVPVRQIDANFVPKEEFKEAVVHVDEESAAIWLENRKSISSSTPDLVQELVVEEEEEQPGKGTLEETEELIDEKPEKNPLKTFPLDKRPVEPIDYIEEASTQPQPVSLEKTPKENLSKDREKVLENKSSSPPAIEEGSKKHVAASVTNPSEEMEVVDLKRFFPKTEANNEKTSISEIGEAQEHLLEELEKELKEVPNPKKQPLVGFAMDYEE